MAVPADTLELMTRAALAAGQEILKVYAGAFDVRRKDDSSPVTEADERAEAVIVDVLREGLPAIPVIAEEAVARGALPEAARRFFLVDPLDGTKEFVSRNGEFTVNIALIEDGRARAGIVFAPATGRCFTGANGEAREALFDPKSAADWLEPHGVAAAQRAIRARTAPADGLVAVASRSHADKKTEEYLSHYPIARMVSAGSSLKFCLVAAGEADIYPRHGTTMEWDTAAGQAVLEAAGGSVKDLHGAPLAYGKFSEGLRNPYFVARGRE